MAGVRRTSLRAVGRAWLRALRGASRGLYDAIASTVSAVFPGGGGYQVLDPNRKVINGLTKMLAQYSANELANLSLPQLRSLCRKLDRDNSTARSAGDAFVAEIIGTGIALEPDTGDEITNQAIKPYLDEFWRGCDITGRRSIYDLQQEAARSWFFAGEHIWRLPVKPDLLDKNRLPVFILPLDSEWLTSDVPERADDAITVVAGMELSKWGEPLAYLLRNPEASAYSDVERVPASEVIHGFEHRRPLQNRGEPHMAPVIERISQEGDLIDTELKSAINCSAMAVVITSQFSSDPDNGSNSDQQTDGTSTSPARDIPLGAVTELFPGEDAKAFKHDRPSQQIAPFVDLLRSSIAAACRISKRWLTRTYDQSWSSQRADAQDSNILLSQLRESIGHTTIGEVYVRILPYVCARAGRPLPKRKAYRLLPDGQPYINPVDEIKAIGMAISQGLTTWEKEIAKRGGDRLETWKQLAKEYQEAKALGLKLDLSGTNAPAPESTIGAGDGAGDGATKPAAAAQDPSGDTVNQEERAAFIRALDSIARDSRDARGGNITISPTIAIPEKLRMEIPAAPAPVVNVAAPVVHVAAPNVSVAAPEVTNDITVMPAPSPVVHVAAPEVTVAAPKVTVENHVEVPQRTIKATPQRDGTVLMEPQD
jgi:lambda family phage portal protein